MLAFVAAAWGAGPAAADGPATRPAPAALATPYLVVEGWFDRPFCSDLYAFALDGTPLRRLTREPLPSCALAGVSADGARVMFVANASALYALHVPHDLVAPLHAGGIGAVAIAPDGRSAAYVANGFEPGAGRSIRAQPLVAGADVERTAVRVAQDPTELAVAPGARQVVFTAWTAGRAELFRCDLAGRTVEPFLTDPAASFYAPAFAPDGKSLLAVREGAADGESAIVSVAWPAGTTTVLRRGPRGVRLADPVYTADGQTVLFDQGGVLSRMAADGRGAEGLSGELDDTPRPATPLRASDRALPVRASSAPLVAGRWVARVEPGEPDGRLVVIDVRTKERKVVPLPKGHLSRAVVVQ